MAKVLEVKYARKFRLKEYESEEIGLTAAPEKGETAEEILTELREQVEAAHEAAQKARDGEEEETEENEEEEEQEETEESEEEESEEEESEEDEGEEEENGEEESEEEESEDDEKEEDDASVSKKGAGNKKAGTKKFRSKAAVYDNTNELHKKLVAEVIESEFPKWDKDDIKKAKAKLASTKMVGEEFLDADGEVLETFRDAFIELMKSSGKSKPSKAAEKKAPAKKTSKKKVTKKK